MADVSQSIRHRKRNCLHMYVAWKLWDWTDGDKRGKFLHNHRHSLKIRLFEIFVYQPKVWTWFPTCRLHDSEMFSLVAKNLPESGMLQIDPIWLSVNWVAVPWQSFVNFASRVGKIPAVSCITSGFSEVWPEPRLSVTSISPSLRSIGSALWNCVIKTNWIVKSNKFQNVCNFLVRMIFWKLCDGKNFLPQKSLRKTLITRGFPFWPLSIFFDVIRECSS